MTESFKFNEYDRGEIMPEIRVVATRITEQLGYGDGTISGREISPDVAAIVDEVIESPDILVPVDMDDETGRQVEDDGCGDGRPVDFITRHGRELKRNLHRAKVFGGGLVMGTAARIGLGLSRGKSLTESYGDTMGQLDEKDIDYGAHTASHVASDKDSGCGAIDKSPEVLEHVSLYAEPIRETISALNIDYEGVNEDFEDVVANFADTARSARQESFSGSRVMQMIKKAGKVVKQLKEDHLERRIVLNTVRDRTVNQQAVWRATGGRAQVFATDIWRLQDIANSLYSTPAEQQKAFLSEVVYTLAVAATLTKGDLPVYVVESEDALVAA